MDERGHGSRRHIGVACTIATSVEERGRLTIIAITSRQVVRHRIQTGLGNVGVLREIVCLIEPAAAGHKIIVGPRTVQP
ncbi:hypothetical protein ASF25_14340 [Methylobacterium sp. Leaf100]|nr:hypothetical protein ASF25_14340 [Methylobacterium sp. Leaf100]